MMFWSLNFHLFYFILSNFVFPVSILVCLSFSIFSQTSNLNTFLNREGHNQRELSVMKGDYLEVTSDNTSILLWDFYPDMPLLFHVHKYLEVVFFTGSQILHCYNNSLSRCWTVRRSGGKQGTVRQRWILEYFFVFLDLGIRFGFCFHMMWMTLSHFESLNIFLPPSDF